MTQPARSFGADALHPFPVPSRAKSRGASARLSLRLPVSYSAKDTTALARKREGRWQPGLADQALHNEVFAGTNNASGVGAALCLASDFLRKPQLGGASPAEAENYRPILWVQEARAIQRSGRPFLHGFPRAWQSRVIHVEAETVKDVLFALEEGLKCRDLACVMGEVVGNPRALDFTASRRLSLTAQKHGVPLWLVRLDAEADLSSARMRWRVCSAPSALRLRAFSQIRGVNFHAPGPPAWQAELFRARGYLPGKWILQDDEVHAEKPGFTNFSTGHLIARDPDFGESNIRESNMPKPNIPRPNIGELKPGCAAPHSRYLVRATVGRSLAAFARM